MYIFQSEKQKSHQNCFNIFAEIRASRPKLRGNCSFPQKFCTRKKGQIKVFYAVFSGL